MKLRSSKGFSVVECLVALSILSLGALGIARSSIEAFVITKRSIRNSIALQLAQSKLEDLAARDPSTLSSANNSTESALVQNHITFRRVTTVTVNSDQSRLVSVSVSCTDSGFGGTATVQDTLPLWGNT